MVKVTVLVPAFNEEGTIEQVLSKLVALPLDSREILVVDDGSTDNTSEVVALLAAQHPSIRLFKQPRNMGKTAAIARAIAESSGEILIIQDADLEYDPDEIADVISPIMNDVADVVYGSRFLVKKASRVLYFYHYVANKFLTLLSNLLTNRNMSDIETCYKAFRREVIVPLDFTSRGFGLEVEITA
ncbi:MAG: glycosyltransferase family 2 protein, partial [Pirellula sp.]